MQIVEIPEPIGEAYYHRYVNGTVQHHEAPWEGDTAECRICGVKATVKGHISMVNLSQSFIRKFLRKRRQKKARGQRSKETTAKLLIIPGP